MGVKEYKNALVCRSTSLTQHDKALPSIPAYFYGHKNSITLYANTVDDNDSAGQRRNLIPPIRGHGNLTPEDYISTSSLDSL